MAKTANPEGQYVFGNSDMKRPFRRKVPAFYDGQYPSSNGLSGKWIAEVRIYTGGIKPGVKIDYTPANYGTRDDTTSPPPRAGFPWLSLVSIIAGI